MMTIADGNIQVLYELSTTAYCNIRKRDGSERGS